MPRREVSLGLGDGDRGNWNVLENPWTSGLVRNGFTSLPERAARPEGCAEGDGGEETEDEPSDVP